MESIQSLNSITQYFSLSNIVIFLVISYYAATAKHNRIDTPHPFLTIILTILTLYPIMYPLIHTLGAY